MIGKLEYCGSGQIRDAKTKRLVSPREIVKAWNESREALGGVRVSVRIKIMDGTHIEDAYEYCAALSRCIGGISVETDFNGVEMVYHHQSRIQWYDEYRRGCER